MHWMDNFLIILIKITMITACIAVFLFLIDELIIKRYEKKK